MRNCVFLLRPRPSKAEESLSVSLLLLSVDEPSQRACNFTAEESVQKNCIELRGRPSLMLHCACLGLYVSLMTSYHDTISFRTALSPSSRVLCALRYHDFMAETITCISGSYSVGHWNSAMMWRRWSWGYKGQESRNLNQHLHPFRILCNSLCKTWKSTKASHDNLYHLSIMTTAIPFFGDTIAICSMVWTVVSDYQDAPEHFKNFSTLVRLVGSTLRRLENKARETTFFEDLDGDS